jgi:hypothetical protein
VDPDQLLQQIKDLLDQYLALGPDTPVAAEAQQFSDAIDSTAPVAQGPDQGAAQPPAGAMGLPPDVGGGADMAPPDMGALPDQGAEPPVKGRDSFDRATKRAGRDLKKKKTAKA